MQTYTSGRLYAGSLVNDTTSNTLAILDTYINQATKRLINLRDWSFLEKTKTIATVASQQAYDLPSNLGKLNNLTVTISSTKYTPKEATSRDFWDKLNQTVMSSDIPEWYYIFNGTVELYPVPSTSSNTITISYQRTQKDLSIADYTTGGILTATNGSASIVGTGTTFTEAMEGRWLRITDSDTANKGDGEWYEIEDYTSATALTLSKLYNGPSISAGNAAYIIGQTSLLPETYQDLPLIKAAEMFSVIPNPERARIYKEMYDQGVQELLDAESNKTSNVSISMRKKVENPNWYPTV